MEGVEKESACTRGLAWSVLEEREGLGSVKLPTSTWLAWILGHLKDRYPEFRVGDRVLQFTPAHEMQRRFGYEQ